MYLYGYLKVTEIYPLLYDKLTLGTSPPYYTSDFSHGTKLRTRRSSHKMKLVNGISKSHNILIFVKQLGTYQAKLLRLKNRRSK